MASIFERARSSGDPDVQRAKRSEVLLTQLYRDEISPPFRVPEIRGLKTLAITSVLALVLFSGTMFFKFNAFILLREEALSREGNLESAIQRRSNLFSNLVNLTLNHASLEHSVFGHTSSARNEIIKKSDLPPEIREKLLAAGKAAEAKPEGADGPGTEGNSGALPADWNKALEGLFSGGTMEGSLGRLLAVVEQYPNIQSSKTYQQAMTQLVNLEDMIATRRVEYNMSLRDYNTAISKFPWKMLADITEFKRIDYYSIDKEDRSAPLITRSMYQELVPMELPGEAGK